MGQSKPFSQDEQAVRARIWERLRERISRTTAESNLFFPSQADFINVREFAASVLDELPGSGLDVDDVAIEFHKMWRVARDRKGSTASL